MLIIKTYLLAKNMLHFLYACCISKDVSKCVTGSSTMKRIVQLSQDTSDTRVASFDTPDARVAFSEVYQNV